MTTNSICLVVMGDGRKDYLAETMASLNYLWNADIAWRILVDDSGDTDYHRYLADTYPHFAVHAHPVRRGMAAAIATGMEAFLATGAPRQLWFEEDMALTGPIDVAEMDAMLTAQSHLAQLVLKRQPYTEPGGVTDFMDANPDLYTEHQCEQGWYVEQNAVYSLNPHLAPRRVIEAVRANPGDGLEAGITNALLAEGYRFAFWGRRHDEPRVSHIGVTRSAGYML